MEVSLKVVDNNACQKKAADLAIGDDRLASAHLTSIISDLSISKLQRAYASSELTPRQVIEQILAKIDASRDENIWLTVLDSEQLQPYLAALEQREPGELPLYGIPFAIKDNIDLAGLPTTAACADFSYQPEQSAFVVQALIDAGAIPIGKTNMDQFATGLAGTRSPYGITRNSADSAYISGGSSSGSALAVAKSQASFAIGTDTTGSTRVPAALNQLVGIKPSLGLLSMTGTVPSCRSLDCLGLLCLNPEDAALILALLCQSDPDDPFTAKADGKREQIIQDLQSCEPITTFRFGIPQANQLEFFGDVGFRGRFNHVIDKLQSLGGTPAVVDFSSFREAATLLYDGPWLAERYLAVQEMMDNPAVEVLDIVNGIIEKGKSYSATDLFASKYRLQGLKARADRELQQVDFLLTPTVGTCYTVQAMEEDPLQLNSNLGFYTHFTNLLDLATVAIPADDSVDVLPFGISLVGPAFSDAELLRYANATMAIKTMAIGACGYKW